MGVATTRNAQQWDRDSFEKVSKDAAAKLRLLYKAASKPAPAPKPLNTRAMVEKLMPVIRQGLDKGVQVKAIAEQLAAVGIVVTPSYLGTIIRSGDTAPKRRAAEPASPANVAPNAAAGQSEPGADDV
jgi:hypothetical protein